MRSWIVGVVRLEAGPELSLQCVVRDQVLRSSDMYGIGPGQSDLNAAVWA